MGLWLYILFVCVPLGELALLIWIGTLIGAGYTIAIVVGTGIVGATLARWQGVRVLRQIRGELSRGQMPAAALFDGAAILFAAALLLTPGVVTDAFGFFLLIPPCRALLRGLLKRWASKRFQVVQAGPTTIDAEVVDARTKDEDPPAEPRLPS
ncbi:MAG: FxsA family protein [Planctomycetota bacterium]|jgi:UPF0716 protein FxsA